MSTVKQKQSEQKKVRSEEELLKIKYTRKNMFDALVVLSAPVVMSVFYYGFRALILIALSVLTAVFCEWAGGKMFKAKVSVTDLWAVVTGLSVAMCLPASSEWWLPCAASAFAILAVRIPFGDYKNTLFVPAAAGIAFVSVCCSDKVFAYSVVSDSVSKTSVFTGEGFIAGESVAHMLTKGNSIGGNIINYIDIIVGNFPGPMGAACILALFGGLIYLLIRRPKNAFMELSFLTVCAVYAALFPRITTGRLTSVFMELTAGMLLFGAVVFLSNDAIAPRHFWAKICYGAFAGLVLMLLRSFSSFEDSTVFAILLANAVAPVFDRHLPLTSAERAAQKSGAEKSEPGQGGELDG